MRTGPREATAGGLGQSMAATKGRRGSLGAGQAEESVTESPGSRRAEGGRGRREITVSKGSMRGTRIAIAGKRAGHQEWDRVRKRERKGKREKHANAQRQRPGCCESRDTPTSRILPGTKHIGSWNHRKDD